MFTGGIESMQLPTRHESDMILSAAQIEARLRARYQAAGYSWRTWDSDRALYRRAVKLAGHPTGVTVEHMESIIMAANKQNSRAIYGERFKSIWGTMRELKLIPPDCRPDEELPYIRRTKGVPRPLSDEQLTTLLTSAMEPARSWFILGAFAGLRAMEVAKLRGADLEQTPDGYVLRIIGKGGKEATIPAHELVVEVIRKYGRLGRLWEVTAHGVSRVACAEMRRLGVQSTFHACRHTFATSVLAASGDITIVQRLLRHESIATSVVYSRIADNKPRAVLAQIQMPLTPPPRIWESASRPTHAA